MAARRGRPIIAFRVDQDVFAALQAEAASEKPPITMSALMDRIACKHTESVCKHPKTTKKRAKRRVNTAGSCVNTGVNTPQPVKRAPGDVEAPDMRFIAWFALQYEQRLGSAYIPSYGRDRRIAKRLLRQLDGTELATRVVRMLDSEDEFIVKTGRDLPIFERFINRFASNGHATARAAAPKGFAGFARPKQQPLISDTEQPPP